MSNGDDLDDGLLYEVDTDFNSALVQSPQEEEQEQEQQALGQETLAGKRQLEENTESDQKSTNDSKPLSKRQKKLASSKLHQKKLEKMEYEKQQKKNVPTMSSESIAEYLATFIRERNPDLSALELDELYFKKSDFISTERYEKERNLDNFQDFINTFSKSPRALVFSVSNIRVADAFRSLGGSKQAVKLFSKNKLKEDLERVNMLLGEIEKEAKGAKNKKNKKQQKAIKYFVATPARMSKIIESTDLFFQGKDKLDIFLDASYLDPKTNSVLTSEDGMVLCKVLKEFLKKKSSVKILLF